MSHPRVNRGCRGCPWLVVLTEPTGPGSGAYRIVSWCGAIRCRSHDQQIAYQLSQLDRLEADLNRFEAQP